MSTTTSNHTGGMFRIPLLCIAALLCMAFIALPAMAAGPVWAAKPAWNTPSVGLWATPALADLDGDGDFDLLIGVDDGVSHAYENTGTSASPAWAAKPAWNSPSVGAGASPGLADLDGDGDFDLLIGAVDGVSYGYKNTGTSASPAWTPQPAWNAPDVGAPDVDEYAFPEFADLDGDGDKDLMIGAGGGVIHAYENTGTTASPAWTAKSAWWNGPHLNDCATPALADLDGDGDLDLLVGDLDGVSHAYENTGTSASPTWTAKPAWNAPAVAEYSSPALADLDGDGDADLMIGATDGTSYGFENGGTVGPSSQIDLKIAGEVSPQVLGTPAVFVKEPNTISVEDVTNAGTETATGIVVALYASDVSNTEPVATTTIASLGAGQSTTVYLVDPTIRNIQGGTVVHTAKVDPDNLIAEISETNNGKSSSNPVSYNGYKGKRYWDYGTDGIPDDITTRQTFDLNGDIVYSTSGGYKGVGWTTRTETWTAANLPVPEGATVEKVLLFFSYNWDQTPGGYPILTTTFNGNPISLGTPYRDWSNFGGYADLEYGLYPAYDVTSFFNKNGDNTLVTTAGTGNKEALYPSTLVVIYSDPTATRKQIFINEEYDYLGVSQNQYQTTMEEATAYAPFAGMTIDTANVQSAHWHSFATNAGPAEGNVFFNGNSVGTNVFTGTTMTADAKVFDVKNYLTPTGNEGAVQGTESGGMGAIQQILVVEYANDTPPVPEFPTMAIPVLVIGTLAAVAVAYRRK